MKIDYLKNQYDNFILDCFNQKTTVSATVFIKGANLIPDSLTQKEYGRSLDARFPNSVKKKYPINLAKSYKIYVYVIDNASLRSYEKYNYQLQKMGQIKPYDIWVSCLYDDVNVNQSDNKTLFDFTEYVAMDGQNFEIRNIVKENFGNKKVIHVFLAKREG